MIAEVATFTSIVVGVAGVAALVLRMVLQTEASNIKQFELFLKVQELCGIDARKNLAAIRVALACITKRELTTKEIEWFLLIPGAFFYLRRYGKVSRNVSVDYCNNGFKFKSEFDSKTKRFIEWSKLVSLYLVSGTSGLMLIWAVPAVLNTGTLNPWVGLHILGYISCVLAVISLFMGIKLDDSKRLIREKLP